MKMEEWLQSLRDCGNIRSFYEEFTGRDIYDNIDEYVGFAAFCFADAFMINMEENEKMFPAVYEINREQIEYMKEKFISRYNEAMEYTELAGVPIDDNSLRAIFHNVLCTMDKDICINNHMLMGSLMLAFEARGLKSPHSFYFSDAASEFNVISNELYGDDW